MLRVGHENPQKEGCRRGGLATMKSSKAKRPLKTPSSLGLHWAQDFFMCFAFPHHKAAASVLLQFHAWDTAGCRSLMRSVAAPRLCAGRRQRHCVCGPGNASLEGKLPSCSQALLPQGFTSSDFQYLRIFSAVLCVWFGPCLINGLTRWNEEFSQQHRIQERAIRS